MAPKTRPQAIEMTETVTADIVEFLHETMADRIADGKDFELSVSINIRDGLVQLIDGSQERQESPNVASASSEDPAALIRKLELWLRKNLPRWLVLGFHGRVSITAAVTEGKATLRTGIGQQKKYRWN